MTFRLLHRTAGPLRLAILVTACAASATLAHGQASRPASGQQIPSAAYTPTLTFDVISIRQSRIEPGATFMVGGGFNGKTSSLKFTNFITYSLILDAYHLARYQLQEPKDWTAEPMYNIEAKADEAADRKLATLSEQQVRLEQQHMLQNMLAERFHLKAHWESREASTYDLIAIKGGSRLHPGGSMPLSPEEKSGFGDHPPPEIQQRGNGQRGYEFLGQNCHIEALTGALSMITGMEVVDKTGLTGTYDFDLQYSQASDEQRQADSALWPDVQQAVQQQLGLKLQRTRGMARVLIVDHIEPPTPN